MARSWARRSFAAETIFMALVICWVFLTERMRRRMSIRLGMAGAPRAPGSLQVCDEAGLEFLDPGDHLGSQRIVQRLLGADLFPQRAVGIVHELIETFFELAAL